MTKRVGERLLERLSEAGVDLVFGIPGNHTVALYRDFTSAGIRHVTTRHEQGAAFMADGYARATGRPGVCVLISGPGLLNAATAIAQARADSVPMLVITGVAAVRDLGMGRGTLHELPDQHAAAAAFCASSATLLDPANLDSLLDRALASFTSGRPGPVHIEIPLDLMDAPVAPRGTPGALPTAPAADPGSIAEAARHLREARTPLLLLGGGAVGAAAELRQLAERLDAPVLNTVNGKGVLPVDHPLTVGGSPALPSLRAALADADRVLAVGTELSETDYDLLMAGGGPDTARWIRIDVDPAVMLGEQRPLLAITSDAQLAATMLLQNLDDAGASRAGAERAASLRDAVRAEPHHHAEMQVFLETIRATLPDVTLVGDSTRPTYYAAWQYECSAPRRYFHSVSGFGTLGYALPAAFGAAAGLDTPVVALLGDGGAQFTLPELTTGAEQLLPVAIIVWNNEGYAEIENSMRAASVPTESTRILTPDFELAARAHHCRYARARDPAALADALRDAASADRPTVVEVRETDFLTTPSGQWYG